MAKDDGGPAFPNLAKITRHGIDGIYETREPISEGGMSLRDWFAGQALVGIMANPERWRDIQRRYDEGKLSYDGASASNATKAYSLADAMLAARKEPSDE